MPIDFSEGFVLPPASAFAPFLIVFLPLLILPLISLLQNHFDFDTPSDLRSQGYINPSQRKRPSNLLDEIDPQYSVPPLPPGKKSAPSSWKIKALLIHPIKSCAPVELDTAEIDAAGMLWDRKFAFAELLPATKPDSNPTWTFRTLRQPGYEKMVHVRPDIWVRPSDINSPTPANERQGFLVVNYPLVPTTTFQKWRRRLGFFPTTTSFRVPLTPPPNHTYPREKVTIWKDSPLWLNYRRHVPDSFSTFLGATHPVTLFRVDPDPHNHRHVFRCAPRREQVGYQPIVGFADAYPLHLLNLASVRDVAHRVKDSIPHFSTRRFRGNLIVTGGPQYDEDDWKRVVVVARADRNDMASKEEEHEVYCACHTIRCRLPNVDPDTSERHPAEPDKTLKSFRCIDPGDPLNAALGLQCVPREAGLWSVSVGDEIRVLERGEHFYIKQ